MNRFDIITKSHHICQIKDEKTVVHEIDINEEDFTSMRILYLMLHACQYNISLFLTKFNNKDFDNFDDNQTSPNLTTDCHST